MTEENIFDQYPINVLMDLLGKTEEEIKNMSELDIIKELAIRIDILEKTKQDILIGGKNIKMINNECILGSGNLNIIPSGIFLDKPEDPAIGFLYFCTDKKTIESNSNGIIIVHIGNNLWTDVLGREIN